VLRGLGIDQRLCTAFPAGHREAALPAAIASGLMFFACLTLYVFVDRLNREGRRQ